MTSSIQMPERIGRFRLQSMLGHGAMGVVYKGHDEYIDRPVAIKLIRADLLDSAERENYFQRFSNEAKIAGRCVHANIVGLYDYSFHNDNPYLVMEYVNGCGLQQALPRGTQRPLDEVLPIALQVLDALQYAHECGIVHRDVKPANILLTPQSRLKITDFGISRLSSSELTMTPLLIGTPSYMSPEQCMGTDLDGRSDLFSLGCVLYELLAGTRPFSGVNYTDTILSIINKPHTPLSSIRSDIPSELGAVLDKALSKKAADRFPDAEAFAHALEEFSSSSVRVPAIPRAITEAVAARQESQPDPQIEEKTVLDSRHHRTLDTPTESFSNEFYDDDATVIASFPPGMHNLHNAEELSREEMPASNPETGGFEPRKAAVPSELYSDTMPSDTPEPEPDNEQCRNNNLPDPSTGVWSEVSDGLVQQDEAPQGQKSEKDAFNWEEWQSWVSYCLTRVIGPIGPKIVARIADEKRPADLVHDCARIIRHSKESTDFLRLVGGQGHLRKRITRG